MWRSLLLQLFILQLTYAAVSWDLAIAVHNTIEFLTISEDGKGSRARNATLREMEVRVLAFDPVRNRMFVSNSSQDNEIFQVDLDEDNNTTLIHKEGGHEILGLAYHHVTDSLFWTNGDGRTISRLFLQDGRKEIVHHLNTSAIGIAVDICSGTLFWSTRNGTIERSSIDGEDHVVLVRDQNNPTDLTVDQRLGRLFWCEHGYGVHFNILSCNLNGSSLNTYLTDVDHRPISIATTKTHIYWTNQRDERLLTVSINGEDKTIRSAYRFQGEPPTGLVSRDNSVMLEDCANLRKPQSTTESVTYAHKSGFETNPDSGSTVDSGYSRSDHGSRVVLHDKFCLNGGTLKEVQYNSQQFLFCECVPGYCGYVCQDECVKSDCSSKSSSPDISGPHHCNCSDECMQSCKQQDQQDITPPLPCLSVEAPSDMNGTNNITKSFHFTEDNVWYNNVRFLQKVVIVLLSLCGILIPIFVYLIKKNLTLRKRPRIKKRIIINKNVTPLTSRPPPADDQCEITIENCCNMNICETPCYEPHLRSDSKKSSKTEEKKNLLDDMEETSSCVPCQDDLY